MCAQIIEARVRQKTDTLANWNANDLVLLGGEPAFVISQDGQPVNFKLGDGTKTFAELPFWIQYDQAAFIPVSGLALPTPTQPVGYSILGEGTYTHTSGGFTVPAGHLGVANWDGSAWSFSDMGLMPQSVPDGLVQLGETKAPDGDKVFKADKAIDDKINSVVVNSNITDIHQDVSASASKYGNTPTVRIYGWGFPLKGRSNITKVSVKLFTDTAVSQQFIRIRKGDNTGEVIHTQSFNIALAGDSVGRLLEFDLSSKIDNLDESELYFEVYCDEPIGIYRVNPAVVFTQALGYTFVRSSTTDDMGATPVSIGSAATNYWDVYHEVTTVNSEVSDFTQWAKDKISEISNENVVVPNDVQEASDIVNAHFTQEIIDDGTFKIFEDGVGPHNNNFYKLGFPVGELGGFDKLSVFLYFLAGGTRIRPTEISLTLKEVNKSGNIIAQSSALAFPTEGGTGQYKIDWNLEAPLFHSGRMYLEIVANGQFGGYRRYPNPASIFTEANGYPPFAMSTTQAGALVDQTFYYDFYFETNILKSVVKMSGVEFDIPELDESANILPNENERESAVVSSVTWGLGFLQDSYLGERIKWKQSVLAKAILPKDISGGELLSNRKYFLGEAMKFTGTGSELSFKIKGNEVSIVQAIERSNVNASEIELYIDDVLYDTFNNFNPSEMGVLNKTFTGNGTDLMFDLGYAFTYGHTITLNGVNQVYTHNTTQGAGFTIPSSSQCAIVRKLGVGTDGKPAVTHWVWFKTAPASGATIVVTGNYGANLSYEKTTIGETATGVLESSYGDGDVSFDPTDPASVSSGLDFRETDERVVKTYRFTENKERNVRLRIKGLYPGSTGTPYFIFNFATNRYFHFQNAGIGGFSLWTLEKNIDQDYLRGWQRVVQFNPDKIIFETTPNEDWLVRGYKIYDSKNVGLTELRAIKNFPLRSIAYQSGTDTYDISRWKGKITAITETSVTFSGTIDTPIVAGDYVLIGNYWSNNFDVIERRVASIAGNTINFDNPIKKSEVIYSSLDGFIGMDIEVRSLEIFKTKLDGVLNKIKGSINPEIYLLENPMPNLLARGLWGYPLFMDRYANENNKVYSVDYESLRKWQYSQPKTSVSVNISSAVLDPFLGKRVIEFGEDGYNLVASDILLNGVSIYGKRAVVQNGWAYTVNQTLTGSALNRSSTVAVNSSQVYDKRKPRVVLLDDTLTSGVLEIKYPTDRWSRDSCHIGAISAKLYADFLRDI